MIKTKNSIAMIFFAIFLVGLTLFVQASECGSQECSNNMTLVIIDAPGPRTISNCVGLQNMNNNLTKNYSLTNNIDCSDTVNWNGGAGFDPIGSLGVYFAGTFNGNGYNITDLYINRPTENYIGLFGNSDGESMFIKNVSMIDVNITGRYYVGGLAGLFDEGSIISSSSSGIVSGQSEIGGLVGWNYRAVINNSSSSVNVFGYKDDTGGLVGINFEGHIYNCFATGNVFSNVSNVGGLVGWNYYSVINNSYAMGNVTGDGNVGGLVGDNSDEGEVYYTYATGYVAGNSDIGGLIGNNENICEDSFWDINTSGQVNSSCGTGKTTVQMKTESTYTNVGWDFTTIWRIDSGNDGYLSLIWQPVTSSTPSERIIIIGGGGSSLCSYDLNFNWDCGAWSKCVEGVQIRACKDYNNCGNNYGKPFEIRNCTIGATQLFDIKLELEETIIKKGEKLTVGTTFQSFGTEPTPINLTYIILDGQENEIYREEEQVIVETEEFVSKTFEDLELPSGKYILILNTLYNVDVEDEFRQEFEVREPVLLTGNIIAGVLEKGNYFLIGIGIFIFVVILIALLKRTSRKKEKEEREKIIKRMKQESSK